MRGIIIKQPNGKYCIFDDNIYKVAKYNLETQDIIDMYITEAQMAINEATQAETIIARTVSTWDYKIKRKVPDDVLKEMGFNKPYDELVKFVSLRPLNPQYASCDFAVYAKCPNCGSSVRDGMGHTDDKCKQCGQMLRWN